MTKQELIAQVARECLPGLAGVKGTDGAVLVAFKVAEFWYIEREKRLKEERRAAEANAEHSKAKCGNGCCPGCPFEV